MLNFKSGSLFCLCLLLFACTQKDNQQAIERFSDQFIHDQLPYSGTYQWTFNLLGGEQVSTHVFYSDKIVYEMKGRVYSTRYTMKKLSYENAQKKWIGEDEKGNVYVLFLKPKSDKTLTIYKHKCKDNDVEEAIDFTFPAANAIEDHGWNDYSQMANSNK